MKVSKENDFGDLEDVPDGTTSGVTDEEADAAEEDSSQEAKTKEIVISKLVLCLKHKPLSSVPLFHTMCENSRKSFKDKAVIKRLILSERESFQQFQYGVQIQQQSLY